MKVLHIIPSLDTGGAQKLLEELLPCLNSYSDTVIELVVFRITGSNIEKKLNDAGIKIHSLGVSVRSPKAIFKLRNYIRKSDIVHLHLFPAHYFTSLANLGLNKPLIFTEHSTSNKRRNHKILRPIEKIVYNRLSKIICISDATKNELLKWLKKNDKDKKFEIIENGIDIHKYRDAHIGSAKHLFGREGKAILMISRFTEAKDHTTVIKALQYIHDSELFVAFAGEGPTMEKVKELATQLNVIERVVFLGNRNDIPELIKTATVGVQSSHWEGFGLTAIEMMAGGLPVIASDVEGLRDIVDDAGCLFERGNEKELAQIIEVLIGNKEVYKKYIEKGYERAKKYSINKAGEYYIKSYKNLLNIPINNVCQGNFEP